MGDDVVLVTGGGRGIGRAVALDLARHGAHVAVHYHRDAASAEAVAEVIRGMDRRAITVQADLRARELPSDFMTSIVGQLGPVTKLVCNAGHFYEDAAAFMSLDDWDDTINLNLRGTLLICQAVLPGMLKRRKGSIVIIGSEIAAYGMKGMGAYAASKAGVVGLARSMAAEAGSRGVRVNVVSPGLIDTELVANIPEDRRQALIELTALGRVGSGEDVAAAVRFLLSDEAAYVTGSVLAVNGGLPAL